MAVMHFNPLGVTTLIRSLVKKDVIIFRPPGAGRLKSRCWFAAGSGVLGRRLLTFEGERVQQDASASHLIKNGEFQAVGIRWSAPVKMCAHAW